MQISQEQYRALALAGAKVKLTEIYATFPELRATQARIETKADHAAATVQRRKPGRRTPMSMAERKAVSVRMRKYWAAKRKAARKQ